MACHALYGVASRFGGNTWDFEAWRKDVDWPTALSVQGRCGQGYGDVPNAASGLQGTLVKSFDTHTSVLSPQTWLVGNLNGLNMRRNVASQRGYGCMVAAGKQVPRWYPSSFLDAYLAANGPAVGDDEACGTRQPPPPGVRLAISGACTTRAGTLVGSTSGFTPGATATIRAWYPSGAEYTNLARSSRVAADGSIVWRWPCQGDPAGTYTTTVVDDVSGASTGEVHFTIGDDRGPSSPQRVNAYENYGGGAAGHAMCRGNPGRPESMPGGTASQTFTVPDWCRCHRHRNGPDRS